MEVLVVEVATEMPVELELLTKDLLVETTQ
jgi:hypothetical protein